MQPLSPPSKSLTRLLLTLRLHATSSLFLQTAHAHSRAASQHLKHFRLLPAPRLQSAPPSLATILIHTKTTETHAFHFTKPEPIPTPLPNLSALSETPPNSTTTRAATIQSTIITIYTRNLSTKTPHRRTPSPT
ncbi:hypothetical protein M758_1G025700 [Ceratodon purpureus]|uniref:Uncharacterized protein n=1 Tax=Ceratodon purpureus TaxID=3225 RepID=A0A8T0J1V0_CERPU|nr:hypothetical protein KC19_1G026900 [Ceratodon purpureus]KAG0628429.1 hypothetical protein M758_1G025700 [Ceratodon purpureus]